MKAELLQALRRVELGTVRRNLDKAALHEAEKAGLAVRGRGKWMLSNRGRDALKVNSTTVAVFAPYCPPKPLPMRAGAMDWKALPSIYAEGKPS